VPGGVKRLGLSLRRQNMYRFLTPPAEASKAVLAAKVPTAEMRYQAGATGKSTCEAPREAAPRVAKRRYAGAARHWAHRRRTEGKAGTRPERASDPAAQRGS